ncbi:hypothetical protein GPSY_0979 [Paraglaciecola psychrophila 170]|nr:hypothetical protein GPSY_0979 [Paraglaciecola psychrophila 170]
MLQVVLAGKVVTATIVNGSNKMGNNLVPAMIFLSFCI